MTRPLKMPAALVSAFDPGLDDPDLVVLHARLRGLRNFARRVFVDRNASGMPPAYRGEIRATTRRHHREAVELICAARTALLRGDLTQWELLAGRAAAKLEHVQVLFRQPLMAGRVAVNVALVPERFTIEAPEPKPIGPQPPKIIAAVHLLKDFKPIESIIDGLPTPRGGLASITAQTGHGKTTVTTLMHAALCRGLPFAGRDVTRDSVLVLAGENPDDYTMHLAATVQDLGLYGAELNRTKPMGELLVIPGTFSIDYELELLSAALEAGGRELVAVFVDTSAAYNRADDENDNVAMRLQASSLRALTTLPGNPCVFVVCHPTKNAQRESLVLRGGGSFLAEVDANPTLWKDESGIVTLHWAGKIRGPSFDPIKFELVPTELDGYTDCRGRPITSVAARHVPEERVEQIVAKQIDDDDVMLIAMQRKAGGSVRELAQQCGWTNGMGKPLHARADRQLKGLARQGLAEQDHKGTWRLTPKGIKEADRLP